MGLFPEESDTNGFSLIELLVVIAVLALLIAIILPALNSAKLSSKQVVCAAQMKQWALAEISYTLENDNNVTPYADFEVLSTGAAFDPKTYWHHRLLSYMDDERDDLWGMSETRRCPMGKEEFGENAVWIGVHYGYYYIDTAPFVFLGRWNGTTFEKRTNPFKSTMVKSPANYLMMLDVRRELVFNFFDWPWNTDHDGDGINDTNATTPPYNFAQPKIHRGGCNVSLFDGHTEWISYKAFWKVGTDGYPAHPYWYNQNHP